MKRIFITLTLLTVAIFAVAAAENTSPLYTTDIAISDSGELVMTQKGRNSVDIYSADGTTVVRRIPMPSTPTGLVISGDVAYVTTFETKGSVEIVSLSKGAIEGSIEVGSGACSPSLTSDGATLYICNQFAGNISKIDVAKRQVVGSVRVLREPKSAVISLDGKYLFVSNFLTAQAATLDHVSASVSVIELASFTKIKDIQLSNGSNALRGITQSPDGKYIYVSHNLGRYTVPTSQLLQGWMNTSAFSIINTNTLEFEGSIIVDDPERGAAGIWDIECDDEHIYITHSGTHEVSVIKHPEMLSRFQAYPNKANLDYDLRFLYGLRTRVPLVGNGPRNMAVRGKEIIVPTYFADMLNFVDVNDKNRVTSQNMNPGRTETAEEKGEKYFNDATFCFQNWQSCNGCHPGDGRADGLNWDLMNDAVGNPKNCKSLLFSHVTPPSMISGIRESAELAVRKGFTHIQFFNVAEEYAASVDEYLKALRPVPSPYLVDGELSAKAVEGRKVFNRLKCNDCHSGAYYTDMKMYRIGDDIEFEAGWDTPTLREVWRTAPYLFDGRAVTMHEVFAVYKHGIEGKVSKKDIEALTEYVLSL